MISRRGFMGNAAAATLLSSMPQLTMAAASPQTLVAGVSRQQIAPQDYPETEVWTLNGQFPGPTLDVAQGARVQVRLDNRLPQPTTLHWHGIRIDNAMDGVPGLTQDAVAPEGVFDYDFAVPDAGTYWYHSHAQSVEQVERGLQGPLIVREADAPDVDRDLVLVLDDIRLNPDATIAEPFDAPHDRSHAGRLGNLALTNGETELTLPVQQGERLRLRLINSSNARIYKLGVQGMEAWRVALDGMPLRSPEPLAGSLVLAPAQRVDLIADVVADAGDEAFLLHEVQGQSYAQVVFPVSAGTQARRPAPAALPPNPEFAPDLNGARPLRVRMEGGAMGGMAGATYFGNRLDMRDLVDLNLFWALNGTAGRPEDPMISLSRGESLRMEMINDTAFPHSMHLHGMHFSVLGPDGSPGPLRDTVLVQPGQTQAVALNAHNPGKWLFHCHMLSHHAAGMVSWIEVRG